MESVLSFQGQHPLQRERNPSCKMSGPAKHRYKMPKKYLSNLNNQQRRAVRHGLISKKPDFRPLLVLAGAGTGKTELITHRVAHLILKGTSPRRILLLAFGRLAAGEMTGRAKRIVASVNGTKVDLPWSGTFHSVGARLLRQPYPAPLISSRQGQLQRLLRIDLV